MSWLRSFIHASPSQMFRLYIPEQSWEEPAHRQRASAVTISSMRRLRWFTHASPSQTLRLYIPEQSWEEPAHRQRASAVTISSMRRLRLFTLARGTASLPTTTLVVHLSITRSRALETRPPGGLKAQHRKPVTSSMYHVLREPACC